MFLGQFDVVSLLIVRFQPVDMDYQFSVVDQFKLGVAWPLETDNSMGAGPLRCQLHIFVQKIIFTKQH